MQALEEAEDNLVIDPYSRSVIEGAMQVESLKVRDVMVPRPKMIMIDSESSTAELLQVMVSSYHSRFPIHDQDQDSILGIVLAKDLLSHFAKDGGDEFNYREYLRDVLSVPESKPLGGLLREFQQNKSHMAIVMDEYGEIAGLVTLEDVIEQIVGEIEDEHDIADEEALYIVPDNDPTTANTWIVQALTPIEHFNTILDADFSDDEVETMGGLLLQEIGLVSDLQGQTIELGDWQFTIIEADARTIHLIRAVRQ